MFYTRFKPNDNEDIKDKAGLDYRKSILIPGGSRYVKRWHSILYIVKVMPL